MKGGRFRNCWVHGAGKPGFIHYRNILQIAAPRNAEYLGRGMSASRTFDMTSPRVPGTSYRRNILYRGAVL